MSIPGKVYTLDALMAQSRAWKGDGLVVVFTNGCFDILHVGHVHCLQAARGMGDRLVVGVNSDESVRLVKGSPRPFIPQAERVEVLAALSCVDAVIIFNDPVPLDLVAALQPDIFVKGGDYQGSFIPEGEVVAAYGGEVRFTASLPGCSTSAIVERILGRAGEQS
jgi:D-beta-D-heptose 7-phosphate kinase/D-beta-D-heptose 1-phosphate adenosyltransferase